MGIAMQKKTVRSKMSQVLIWPMGWVKTSLPLMLLLYSTLAYAAVEPDIFDAFEGETVTLTTAQGFEIQGLLKKVNSEKKQIVFVQASGKVVLLKMADIEKVTASELKPASQGVGVSNAGSAPPPVNPECATLPQKSIELEEAKQAFERSKTLCSAGGGLGQAAGKAALDQVTGSIPFVGGLLSSAGSKAIGNKVESACLESKEAKRYEQLSQEYNALNAECNGAGAGVAAMGATAPGVVARRAPATGFAGAPAVPVGMSPRLTLAYHRYLRSGETHIKFPVYLDRQADAASSSGIGLLIGLGLVAGPLMVGIGAGVLGLEEEDCGTDEYDYCDINPAGFVLTVVGGTLGFVGLVAGAATLGMSGQYRALSNEAKRLAGTHSLGNLKLEGLTEVRDIRGQTSGMGMAFSF